MAENTLKPYMVVLSFAEGGPLCLNAVLAPNPQSAVAMFSVMTMRELAPPQSLMGCAVGELTPEFLRNALRAIEGRLPPDGNAQVVSLVPQAAPQIDQAQPYPGPQDDPPAA